MTALDFLPDVLRDAVSSCLPPVELLALCATSKAMEARFLVTMDFLPRCVLFHPFLSP